MITTLDKAMLMMGISLEGLAVMAQTTPLAFPTDLTNFSALAIVTFVVWRLFMVEMPAWRESIRDMVKSQNETVETLSLRIEALREELRSNPCLLHKDTDH